MATELLNSRYQILQPLERGGMGAAFLARDIEKKRELVVKTVAGAASLPANRDLARHEFEILSRLDHPGIEAVYEFDLARGEGPLPPGTPFITCEILSGPDILAARGLPVDVQVAYVAQVCEALHHVHEKGLVHNDIKPRNILLIGDVASGEARAKIVEFALACEPADSTGSTISGGVPYMAPERLAGDQGSTKSDLYSLGAVIHELVTGSPPFGATGSEILSGTPDAVDLSLPEEASGGPDALLLVARRLLERDPARRPGSAREVMGELSIARGGVRSEPDRAGDRGPAREEPLLGRYEGRPSDVEFLRTAIDDLAAGRPGPGEPPGMVLLSGPVGTGKSRLVREVRARSCLRGLRFSEVQPAKFVQALADLVGLAPEAGAPEMLAALERRMEESAPASFLPVVYHLPDLELASADAVQEVLRAAASIRQARAKSGWRILLIATARGTSGTLDRSACLGKTLETVRAIELGPLDGRELRDLVCELLGWQDPPEYFVEEVMRLSGGLPLLVEEALRAFALEGALFFDGTRWLIAEGRLPNISAKIPKDDGELVRREVKRRSAAERKIFSVLAATRIGLPLSSIGRATKLSRVRVLAAMASLVREGLVAPSGEKAGAPTYQPRSAFLARVFIESLDDGERRGLLAAVAGAMEDERDAAFPRPAYLAELVRLYGEAGDGEKTVHLGQEAIESGVAVVRGWDSAFVEGRFLPLLRAKKAPGLPKALRAFGDAAKRAGDLAKARAYFDEALQEGADVLDHLDGAGLYLRAAECAYRAGETQPADDACANGLATLKSPDSNDATESARLVAKLRILLARVRARQGRFDDAFDEAQEAMRLQTGIEEDYEVAYEDIARCHARRGSYQEALRFYRKSLALRRRRGKMTAGAGTLGNIGLCHLALGQAARARRAFASGERAARRTGDLRQIAHLVGNRAVLAFREGRYTEAREGHHECRELFERIQDAYHASLSLNNLGAVYLAEDDIVTAGTHFERAREIFDDLQAREERGGVLLNLALVHAWRGQFIEALQVNEEGISLCREIGDNPRLVEHLSAATSIKLAIGDVSGALARAREGATLAGSSPDESMRGVGDLALARAALAAGDFSEGESACQRALESFQQTGDVREAIEANLVLSQLVWRAGEPERALSIVETCRGDIEHMGVRSLLAKGELLEGEIALGSGEEPVERRASRALEKAEKSLDLIREIGEPPLLTAAALLIAARALARLGRSEDAWNTWRRGRQILERTSARVPGPYRMPFLAQAGYDAPADVGEEKGAFERSGPPPGEGAARMGIEVMLSIFRRILSTGLDMEALLGVAVQSAMEVLGAERGFLALVDESGRPSFLCLRGTESAGSKEPVEEIRLAAVREIAASNRSLLASGPKEESRREVAPGVADPGSPPVLGVPVRWGERPIAVLYLERAPGASPFSLEDLAVLDELALLMAGPIRSSHLYEVETRELDSIREVLSETKIHDGGRYACGGMLGRTRPMQQLYRMVDRVAGTTLPVLISGETGSGKETVARAIHSSGPRRERPFLALSCGAVPETLVDVELFGCRRGAYSGASDDRKGLFEQASGGTLLLDQVDEMSPSMQSKLLRVVENGVVRPVGGEATTAVDVRILSTSERDLAECVAAGTFRRDLFYRLNVVQIRVPPLRERRGDIPLHAEHFLAEFARTSGKPPKTLSSEALRKLLAHDWPGNVRELRNVLEWACLVARGPVLSARDLRIDKPLPARNKAGIRTLAQVEVEAIRDALRRAASKAEAAKLLGMNRRTLDRKIANYGL